MSDSAIVLFGIPHCDQVKKARGWLDERSIPYLFHDFKKMGVSAELISGWQEVLGWEAILNRRGTTWRQLPEDRKSGVTDARSATSVMCEFPSVIKRPILCAGRRCIAGFSETAYQTLLET